MEPLQDPAVLPWIAAATVFFALLVAVLLFRAARRSRTPIHSGLPDGPEGWDTLEMGGGPERPAADELVGAVQRTGAPRSGYYRAELPSGRRVALGHTPRHPWVDVFVRRRRERDAGEGASGPYEIYSYHLREERWSYGAVPHDAREIERVIQSGFAGFVESGRR